MDGICIVVAKLLDYLPDLFVFLTACEIPNDTLKPSKRESVAWHQRMQSREGNVLQGAGLPFVVELVVQSTLDGDVHGSYLCPGLPSACRYVPARKHTVLSGLPMRVASGPDNLDNASVPTWVRSDGEYGITIQQDKSWH